MLLFVLAGLRVLVFENEVDLRVSASVVTEVEVAYLVRRTTFVWAKHDHVRGRVGEFVGTESRILFEQLHVCTTALQALL